MSSDGVACVVSWPYGANHMIMDQADDLMRQAADLGVAGAVARKSGQEAMAEKQFRAAYKFALRASELCGEATLRHRQLEHLRTAVIFALSCGEVEVARKLIKKAVSNDHFAEHKEKWAQMLETSAWTDEWLVAAVRREPPDEASLDILADRYWKRLFARCQMLTLNFEEARDLAQQTWCRTLRARSSLKPGGNFPGFLATVARNLWRDWHRSAKRAGPLGEHRLLSLDATFSSEEGDLAVLGDTLADLNALRAEDQRLLAGDIDRAMQKLSPWLRETLVARLIDGESCAEIGRRYGRSEQTISGWVRRGIRDMKRNLRELDQVSTGDNQS